MYFFFYTFVTALLTTARGVYNREDIKEMVIFDQNKSVDSALKIFPPCEARNESCWHSHRSFNMRELADKAQLLNNNIGVIMKKPNWISDYELEGNSLEYFHKSKILMDIVDDPRVETICEIGFNSGYSAITFLIANRRAKLISFDIFTHEYGGAAVRAVQDLFPGRNTAFIAGNSSTSVPAAAPLLSQQKCNVIFIDGGHTVMDLRTDLNNMRAYANETFNMVIIDDLEAPGLLKEWYRTPQMDFMDTIICSGFRSLNYEFNEMNYTFEFILEQHFYDTAIGIGAYIF